MCLAIPGKLIEKYEENGMPMGRMDFGGSKNSACLICVPEMAPGQYAMIHAGFALHIVDEEEARRSYEAWKEIEAAEKEWNKDDEIPE